MNTAGLGHEHGLGERRDHCSRESELCCVVTAALGTRGRQVTRFPV